MEHTASAYLIAAVIAAPPVVWALWEMACTWRERRARERIARTTWGDGTP